MKASIVGIIYKHANKSNGKCYIGQTIQWENPQRRWRQQDSKHLSYKSCAVFYRALNKYSWSGFDTEILFVGFSQEALNLAEEMYINLYNSLVPTGYNTAFFVEGSGKRHESTGKKISEAKLKYYSNPEVDRTPHNKVQHREINGLVHKFCGSCRTWHPLSNFSKDTTWDKLTRQCRECRSRIKASMYFREAYEDGTFIFLKTNENYLRKNGPSKSFTATKDGVSTKYNSMAEFIKQHGGHPRSISKSLKNGTIYKGHTFTKV